MSKPLPAGARRAGRRAVGNEVVDQIKALIVTRQLRPGDPLPTEAELCLELDASRSSIREAIKTLSALDIVEVRHGHGTYVGRISMSALVEALAFRGLLAYEDDSQVLADLVEVREVLETGMAPTLLAGVSPGYLESLLELTDQMAEKAAAGREFSDEDREFHLLMVQPAANDLVSQLTVAFWEVHARVAPQNLAARDALVESAANHRAIVDAARGGDVDELRQAIVVHYGPVRGRISALLKKRR